MAALAHMGIGFAAKPLAPKVNIVALVVASEIIDLTCGVFFALNIERIGFVPYSHSLIGALFLAILVGVLAGLIVRDKKSGLVVGLVVFSHWVLDVLSHPMFMGGTEPDIPLFLDNQIRLGFGLYQNLIIGMILDIGIFLSGIAVYVIYRIKNKRKVEKEA